VGELGPSSAELALERSFSVRTEERIGEEGGKEGGGEHFARARFR